MLSFAYFSVFLNSRLLAAAKTCAPSLNDDYSKRKEHNNNKNNNNNESIHQFKRVSMFAKVIRRTAASKSTASSLFGMISIDCFFKIRDKTGSSTVRKCSSIRTIDKDYSTYLHARSVHFTSGAASAKRFLAGRWCWGAGQRWCKKTCKTLIYLNERGDGNSLWAWGQQSFKYSSGV